MNETLNLGKVDFEGRGRKVNEVTVTVTLENGRLSMQGKVWNARHHDLVSGGQNYDTIAALFPRDAKVQRMVEVWRRWHLNDMRAGCEHQRAEGWGERPIDPSSYGKDFPGRGGLGWVRPDEHPDGLLGKPCPTCGYRYGTAWLTKELPAEIIKEVESW